VRSRLLSNKSPGWDEVINEVLRVLLDDPLGFSLLLRFFNFCWASVKAPALWQLAVVVAIFKNKGSARLPTNYRPISLLSALLKVYTSLIDRRLRILEHRIWSQQFGFLSGRSTDDANFLLLRLQEVCSAWQNFPLYILLLDWIKCYDRIHHDRMMNAFERFGLPQHYIDVMMCLYKDLKFVVRDAWGLSEEHSQAEGIRQGDPLSCFLLLILMTVIMLDARKSFFETCEARGFGAMARYMERVFGFQDVEFADDSNLVNCHLMSLRVLTTCYLREARYYGFEANNAPVEGKCYLIALNPDVPNLTVKDLDGRVFPVVPEAKTLGMYYGRGFLTAATIFRERISSMHKAMNQYKLVWQSSITLREKTTKMNALVWNRGRWSLHLFPLSKTNRRLIDAAQARFLRRLTKIPAAFISRVSHAQVRRRCETLRFSTFIFRAQLRWLGHILRKPRTDPLKKILFEPLSNFRPFRPVSPTPNIPTKRKVGRPHPDWAQTLFSENTVSHEPIAIM